MAQVTEPLLRAGALERTGLTPRHRTWPHCASPSSKPTLASCQRYARASTSVSGRPTIALTAFEQIFATLAEHGRLTIQTLVARSRIPSRRVRAGLANLLEGQLLLHFAADDGAPTYYSVNWRNAYNLARHANIVELVDDRYDERAGHMVGNILQLGHARIGDLADAYELAPGSKRDSGIDTTANGVTKPGMANGEAGIGAPSHAQAPSANEFHATLRALLRSGILVKVAPRSYMPSSDLQEQLEETVVLQFPDRKVSGTKKQAEFRAGMGALKRAWRDEDQYSDLHDSGSQGTFKRPGEQFQSSNKRVKLNGASSGLDAVTGGQEVPKLSVLCCCISCRKALH